jgi:hypothetical protein
MKKQTADSIKAVLCLIVILILSRIPGIFPWWGFVVPVIIFGLIISMANWKLPYFGIGFFSGFLMWLGANLYYDLTGGSVILERLALSVALPAPVLFLISCLIGSLLTGLALYTGKLMAPKPTENIFST